MTGGRSLIHFAAAIVLLAAAACTAEKQGAEMEDPADAVFEDADGVGLDGESTDAADAAGDAADSAGDALEDAIADVEDPPPPPPPPSPPTSAQPEDEPFRDGGPGAQGGVALPDDYEIVSNVLPPTESYLPGADNMPTGVVLLDQRAGARNSALCLALLGETTATIPTEVAARARNPQGDFLVTHWLTRTPVANEGDCDALLAAYDFERASRIKQTYALNDSRGPMFLALDPGGAIIFLDLEDASSAQVFQATADWMAMALKAPQTGPDAGRPPPAPGIAAGANRLFASIAGGFASLVRGAEPTLVRFNDPVTGTAREFRIYRAGVYLIGATFVL